MAYRNKVWELDEDCGATLLDRVVNRDGDLVVQADLTGITYTVFDLDDSNKKIASAALDKTTVIFDTEQTGANYPYATGYNFCWEVPASCFPDGGHTYRIEIIADPVSGEDFLIGPFECFARNLLTG